MNRARASGGTGVRGLGAPASRARCAHRELLVAVILLSAVVLGGVYLALRPAPGRIDDWLQQFVPASKSSTLTALVVVRYPLCIVIGSIVACAVTVRRDRPRAVACLVGPSLALALSELVVKPAVGRTLGGSFSYPSGSTVGAAALGVAAVLATPERLRAITAPAAVVYALVMAVAVVSLGWHLPTDALAGLAWGVGVVVMADASAWLFARRWASRFTRGP